MHFYLNEIFKTIMKKILFLLAMKIYGVPNTHKARRKMERTFKNNKNYIYLHRYKKE